MVNRWRALPPYTRMWVAGIVVCWAFIVLELILGAIFGHTRAWPPIFRTMIVIVVVTAATFWMLGTIRAVRFLRAKRRQRTSGSSSPA
jgi:hypothetical protein